MKQTVLITGASGGIGSAIALRLAEEGHDFILQYSRNKEAVEKTANNVRQKGCSATIVKADLMNREDVHHLIEKAQPAGALVFAAGMSQYSLLQDVSDEEMDALWNVHVKAPMVIARALVSGLLSKPGASLTFISSIWGETGASCESVYSAVKGAQIAFAKALAKELGPSGVRVNAVAPGAVQTAMTSGFSKEELEAIASDIPLGRLAKPNEIAASVAFLLSADASYITGHVLSVNGGWYA